MTGILNVETTNLTLEDTQVTFSIESVDPSTGKPTAQSQSFLSKSQSSLSYVTYVNQQNKPVSVQISNINLQNNKITFEAMFPGKTDFLNGLTIAAVTSTNTFASADDVAAATQFGPGLIEVN